MAVSPPLLVITQALHLVAEFTGDARIDADQVNGEAMGERLQSRFIHLLAPWTRNGAFSTHPHVT